MEVKRYFQVLSEGRSTDSDFKNSCSIISLFTQLSFNLATFFYIEHKAGYCMYIVCFLTHQVQWAVSVGEVKGSQAVGLTQEVVEMLNIKQNITHIRDVTALGGYSRGLMMTDNVILTPAYCMYLLWTLIVFLKCFLVFTIPFLLSFIIFHHFWFPTSNLPSFIYIIPDLI